MLNVLKNNNAEILSSINSINSVVSIKAIDNPDNFKPPSSADIERYKFINRLKECRKKNDMNQKKPAIKG